MPKTNIDRTVRERPPRSRRGVANASDRPIRKATPTAMSTNPMTMLRYRMKSATPSPPARITKPRTVNTARKPAETDALTTSARATPAWAGSSAGAWFSRPRKYER
jgi:hypothetical protein